MELLDLPIELLGLIIENVYDPWQVDVRTNGVIQEAIEGLPAIDSLLTCRTFYQLASKAQLQAFTGRLVVHEFRRELCVMGSELCNEVQKKPRLRLILDRVHTVRIMNPDKNPALWRVSMNWDQFPALRRVEFDCRHRFHFALRHVESKDDYLSNKDGEVVKFMDYRKSFFLGCERFLSRAVKRGVGVMVLREIGLRDDWNGKAYAVAIAMDYVKNPTDDIEVDPTSIQTRSTMIVKWPDGIRPALESLVL